MKVNLKSGQSFVDVAIFRSLSLSCQKVGHSLHRAIYFDYLKQFLNKLSEEIEIHVRAQFSVYRSCYVNDRL